MRTIIAGGRDLIWNASYQLWLDEMHAALPITHVISGGARGADSCGEMWAKLSHVPCTVFPADWKRHGKAAGPIRNRQMAEAADALLAFPGGKGTANMIETACSLGLRVILYGDYP